MNYLFRKLKADEIECRVGTIGKNEVGVSLLLYKTARVDANILDETFGSFNWQGDYKELKENCYSGIGIWNEKLQQWVWKWDTGKETKTEAEKGEASDSFKRAGFKWGIGRELYTSPYIWVNGSKDDRYSVKSITINDDRVITELTIINEKTHQVVFSYPKNIKRDENDHSNKSLTGDKANMTSDQVDELEKLGYTIAEVVARLNKPTTSITYNEMEEVLKKCRLKPRAKENK